MNAPHDFRLDMRRVAAAFDRAAPSYDTHAVLQHTVAERMLERLDVLKICSARLLDLGAGTGYAASLLRQRYPGSQVVLLDLSAGMLREARKLASGATADRYIQANAESLPLAESCVDLLYSNLTLQWCNDLDGAFREARRVLRSTGLILFSTLGPGTLQELRSSWAGVDGGTHVHAFMDMHDIGDGLIRAGFAAPVMDVEHFTLTYPGLDGLVRDLRALGAINASMNRRRGMTGRRQWRALLEHYEAFRRDGVLPVTYEVVYGHAWVPARGERPQDGSTVSFFPADQLRRASWPRR
ncbi:MAG: malonyl-ACP O-methyltransferase BioC [Gammaproteobacteria bacterium]